MLFLGQIRAHKVNSSFAAAHLHYLHETNEKILRDLTGSSASSGVEALLADSHAWAEELSKTLAELSGSIDNPLIIESGAKRIDEIGQHAQHLEASF